MTAPAPTTFTVPVTGGDLLVHDLSGPDASADAPLVVLVHGITANGLSWLETAHSLSQAMTGSRIWAPDLRGRAGSRDVSGPYGLAAHVQDLVAIADHAAKIGKVTRYSAGPQVNTVVTELCTNARSHSQEISCVANSTVAEISHRPSHLPMKYTGRRVRSV